MMTQQFSSLGGCGLLQVDAWPWPRWRTLQEDLMAKMRDLNSGRRCVRKKQRTAMLAMNNLGQPRPRGKLNPEGMLAKAAPDQLLIGLSDEMLRCVWAAIKKFHSQEA